MKNKTKLAAYVVLPVLGLGLIGAGVASAHGIFGFLGGATGQDPQQASTAQENWFQQMSKVLGISEDTLKSDWAQGESMQQIMKDNNISESTVQTNLRDLRLQQVKDDLAAMVSNGVITQSQADSRLQFLQNQNGGNGTSTKGNGGFGMGFVMGGHRGRGMMGF